MSTSTLTVTILDTATIYETTGRNGEAGEAVFRYDLPGAGIVEGWALSGVLEQIASIEHDDLDVVREPGALDNPHSCVGEALEVLSRHVHGVSRPRVGAARQTEAHARPEQHNEDHEYTADNEPDEAADNLRTSRGRVGPTRRERRLQERRERRDRRGKGRRGPRFAIEEMNLKVAAALLAPMLVISGASVWVLSGGGVPGLHQRAAANTAQGKVSTTPADPSLALLGAAGEKTGDKAASASTAAAPTSAEVRAGAVRTAAEGLSFVLPQGYSWEVKDGVVVAKGPDPHVRIIMAADPAYSVPAEELLEQVRREIASDDALGQEESRDGRLFYVESPGDGSTVAWQTWVEQDTQVSLGCHTKDVATVAHKAACRMVAEQLRVEKKL